MCVCAYARGLACIKDCVYLKYNIHVVSCDGNPTSVSMMDISGTMQIRKHRNICPFSNIRKGCRNLVASDWVMQWGTCVMSIFSTSRCLIKQSFSNAVFVLCICLMGQYLDLRFNLKLLIYFNHNSDTFTSPNANWFHVRVVWFVS